MESTIIFCLMFFVLTSSESGWANGFCEKNLLVSKESSPSQVGLASVLEEAKVKYLWHELRPQALPSILKMKKLVARNFLPQAENGSVNRKHGDGNFAYTQAIFHDPFRPFGTWGGFEFPEEANEGLAMIYFSPRVIDSGTFQHASPYRQSGVFNTHTHNSLKSVRASELSFDWIMDIPYKNRNEFVFSPELTFEYEEIKIIISHNQYQEIIDRLYKEVSTEIDWGSFIFSSEDPLINPTDEEIESHLIYLAMTDWPKAVSEAEQYLEIYRGGRAAAEIVIAEYHHQKSSNKDDAIKSAGLIWKKHYYAIEGILGREWR